MNLMPVWKEIGATNRLQWLGSCDEKAQIKNVNCDSRCGNYK